MLLNDAYRLANALGKPEPSARFIFCGFMGNPATVAPSAWRPFPWQPGERLPRQPSARFNGYITLSTFRQSPVDHTFRRRGDLFVDARGIMVDDIGTKLRPLPILPTARIETSPGNEQWVYLFCEPVTDRNAVKTLINAVISTYAGVDPGMGGENRVIRLPGYGNTKPSNPRGWVCRLIAMDDQQKWKGPAALAADLGVPLRNSNVLREAVVRNEQDVAANIDWFLEVVNWLWRNRMIKSRNIDSSGWIQISCPWAHLHSMRADTGAAIHAPCVENMGIGSFRCHHGSCAERGWSDLSEWTMERIAEELSEANDAGV